MIERGYATYTYPEVKQDFHEVEMNSRVPGPERRIII